MEIGHHTEASTAVLDDIGGGSPPSQGFLLWILVIYLEVLPVENAVHFLYDRTAVACNLTEKFDEKGKQSFNSVLIMAKDHYVIA